MQETAPLFVLLVEDNPDHALLTGRALKRDPRVGEVEVKHDGADALAWLQEHAGAPPDAIVVDLKLPGLSGFELIERLKQDERLREVPVVILSTSAREDEIAQGLRQGACGFLTKPIRVDEFLEHVDRATRQG